MSIGIKDTKRKRNSMHKLEKLILESYGELTLREEEQSRGTLGLEELPKSFRDSIEKRYGTSKWPDKDFVSSDMKTYFKTISVDKTTGNIGHRPISLPSFEGLYTNFSDIVGDIKGLMNNQDVRTDKRARELFELIKTNFRKLQSYLRNERPDQYELMKMRRSMEESVKTLKEMYNQEEELRLDLIAHRLFKKDYSKLSDEDKQVVLKDKHKVGVHESLLSDLKEAEEDEVKPEEEPDTSAPEETVLEDATDTILSKFPTLKAAIIKLQTEDFKEFVDSIDWISPRPSEFRINMKNGQEYILKWTGKSFQAQILGKRYFIDKIDDYQQALDKLAILYKEGPMKGAGEGEPADVDSGSSGGGGGDFPGEEGGGDSGVDALGGDDTVDAGGEEGGADLTDEPVDFEEPAEEPEA